MKEIDNSLMSPSEFEKDSIRQYCGHEVEKPLVYDFRLKTLVFEIYKHTFPRYNIGLELERRLDSERRQRELDSMFGMD